MRNLVNISELVLLGIAFAMLLAGYMWEPAVLAFIVGVSALTKEKA